MNTIRRPHRLDPLLRPRSVAVLGASERPNSVGRQTVENLLLGDYSGGLYAVNPGYESVLGVPCYPDLEALPETAEHVVFAIGDPRVESALDHVITHGARAVTIMSSLALKIDTDPPLKDRVAEKVRAAKLLVCGGNAMGFYNFMDGVWVCGFDTRENHVRGGNVTLISHSGSGMSGIVDCEERIDFNLAVSTGQELCVAMHEYLDFALEQPETRAIGLFMEAARDPGGLIAALEKANARGIPVVALKVGRTELAARLAVSHSGAIAGQDDAYQALFDRYGVQRVADMDELATALIMFAQPHPVAEGGLVSIHDSGGERQLLIDLADRMGVPLAKVSEETTRRLESLLDPGLPAVNPLDAWGAGGPQSDRIMEDCLAALMSDGHAAMGAVVHDRGPLSAIYPEYLGYLRKGFEASGKPVFLVANRQGTGSDPRVAATTGAGFPVLDGLRPFLAGVKCLLDHRDFRLRSIGPPPRPGRETVSKWRSRLAEGITLDESESGRLLAEFGIPMNPESEATDEAGVIAAAKSLGFPVALKTAEPAILHKTDHAGVRLAIAGEADLLAAYRDISERLGPRVMISPMVVETGVEMVLGLVRDEQFGPLVMLGFGGINVEALGDVACALPPFDAATARRLVDSLHRRALLDRLRDRPAVDIGAFCEAAARFSVLADCLAGVIDEVDVNPVIVHPGGCVAVDSLVVGRRPAT